MLIHVLDASGGITYASPAFRRMAEGDAGPRGGPTDGPPLRPAVATGGAIRNPESG